MKTYYQEGDVIDVTAPYDVSAGDGVLVGNIFGFALSDTSSGDTVSIVTRGVIDAAAKTAGQVWTQGTILYWDDSTAKSLTTTSSAHKRVGTAAAAAASADTTGRIRLDGVAT